MIEKYTESRGVPSALNLPTRGPNTIRKASAAPPAMAPDLISRFAARGTRAAVIITSGSGEGGDAGYGGTVGVAGASQGAGAANYDEGGYGGTLEGGSSAGESAAGSSGAGAPTFVGIPA